MTHRGTTPRNPLETRNFIQMVSSHVIRLAGVSGQIVELKEWGPGSLALPSRRALVLENVALRRQVAVYQRATKRPRLRNADHLLWVWLSRCWSGWRDALILVQPRTVVGWYHCGFRLYWRWKSRQSGRKTGRPRITAELRALIRRMKRANPL